MAAAHGRFVWYELMTTDAEAAKAFYGSVIGWGSRDASAPGMTYALFTAGEAAVGGVASLPPEARNMGAAPRWLGYVGVEDVDAAVDRIVGLGGVVHRPPTDVPDVSRFSIVADPQMATLALLSWLGPAAQAPAADAAGAAGAVGSVGWHELLAADWERAFAFYRALFGWQKVGADVNAQGTYQLFAAGGETIGGMSSKPAGVPLAFWLYYFNVDDVDAAAGRVRAGGGQVLEGPLEAPGGGFIARCVDPQGAMFALRGQRSTKAIGYFEPAASRDAAARFYVRKAAPHGPASG